MVLINVKSRLVSLGPVNASLMTQQADGSLFIMQLQYPVVCGGILGDASVDKHVT